MASINATPKLSTVDLYSSVTDIPSGLYLGSLEYGNNGKAFRFCKAGSSALTVGNVLQSSAIDAQFDAMAVAVAGAKGDTQLQVTLGSTAITANQFDGGTLTIQVAAATATLADEYTIVAHTAASGAATCVFYLDRPLRIPVTVATNKITVRRSPWSGVIQCPTTLTGTVVGVAIYAIPAGEYGWIQTKGVASVQSDSSTCAVGSDVGVPGATAGCIGVNVAGTGKCNTVGRAMKAFTGGSLPVQTYLCID